MTIMTRSNRILTGADPKTSHFPSILASAKRQLSLIVVACIVLWAPNTQAAQAMEGTLALPRSVSLQAEYVSFNLPAKAQHTEDCCWAYSILGCLEMELSRARGKGISLSGRYLVWAAEKADLDVVDQSGSNFGRAARALERFGICEDKLVPPKPLGKADTKVNDKTTAQETPITTAAIKNALQLGRGLRVNWLRFYHTPTGLTPKSCVFWEPAIRWTKPSTAIA
jgi:hypothetical protein